MKISIVTPTLNQPDWLKFCISSVADQLSTERADSFEIEHIIQDGGSERSKLPQKQSADSRYSLRVYTEKDSGMYDALRRGFEKASGDLIAHLNSDEQYLPGTLQSVIKWFAHHPEKEMMFGDAIMVGSDGCYLSSRFVAIPTPLHMRLSGNLTVFTAATFFRKQMLDRGIHYDASWKVVGDADWICRLVENGVPMGVRRGYLSTFTWNPNILSNTALGDAERLRLRASVPGNLRWLNWPLILRNRLQRMFSGAYLLKPHSYAIYTKSSPIERQLFHVKNPTFLWPKLTAGGV